MFSVRAPIPHQTDAPDFSFERTETGADFDVELIVQTLADLGVVRAVGNL